MRLKPSFADLAGTRMRSSTAELASPVTVGVVSTSRPSSAAVISSQITIGLIMRRPVTIAVARILALPPLDLISGSVTIRERASHPPERDFCAQPQCRQPRPLVADRFCEFATPSVDSTAKSEKDSAKLQSRVVAGFDLAPPCYTIGLFPSPLHGAC